MLQCSIITLFPDMVQAYCQSSILGRAQSKGILTVETINPRDFTDDPYRKVDDSPYGGGPGMVMMCQPLMTAFESLGPLSSSSRVILTSPWGPPLQQSMVQAYATESDHLVIFCGHYEGVDARLLALIPQLELVSLGDFILTGGELAAMAIVDATTRLLPGVLIKEGVTQEESFSSGLLEYPHYTRPVEFRGHAVPEILLSGHHGHIAQWRQEQAEQLTKRYRPDLLG